MTVVLASDWQQSAINATQDPNPALLLSSLPLWRLWSEPIAQQLNHRSIRQAAWTPAVNLLELVTKGVRRRIYLKTQIS